MTAGPEPRRVDAGQWRACAEAAHADGLVWFDQLLAVDEPDRGEIDVVLRVGSSDARRRLALRTSVPRQDGVLPTLSDLWAGASWAEREAHEMLGVGFEGHPALTPLLLAPGAPAHPLRRDALLPARQGTAWPGEKDPSDRRVGEGLPPAKAGGRRRLLPPGVVVQGDQP